MATQNENTYCILYKLYNHTDLKPCIIKPILHRVFITIHIS